MRTTPTRLAATALLAGLAFAPLALAQSAGGTGTATGAAPGAPSAGTPDAATGATTTPGSAVVPPSSSGAPAVTPATPVGQGSSATGNPAVHTDSTAAAEPASGANSFTMKEARRRLMRHGYTNVSGLKKDTHGVWNASATKDGSPVMVWLDFKGNVGTR